MGKKSIQYRTSINIAIAKVRVSCQQLVEDHLGDNLEKNLEECQEMIGDFDFTDEEIDRIQRLLAQINDDAGDLDRVLDDIENEIGAALDLIDEFDDFLDAKERSRNPFKSKESLPASREYSETVKKDLQQYRRSVRSASEISGAAKALCRLYGERLENA